jgi:hypothetical protein
MKLRHLSFDKKWKELLSEHKHPSPDVTPIHTPDNKEVIKQPVKKKRPTKRRTQDYIRFTIR